MFIKHFREVTYRVADPLHPGHTVFDRRMDASKTYDITHNGVAYKADADGWFDVPPEVAAHFLGTNGSPGFPGWCSPEMVDEEVVAGRIRADAADIVPSTREKLEAGKPVGKPNRSPKQKGTAVVASKTV